MTPSSVEGLEINSKIPPRSRSNHRPMPHPNATTCAFGSWPTWCSKKNFARPSRPPLSEEDTKAAETGGSKGMLVRLAGVAIWEPIWRISTLLMGAATLILSLSISILFHSLALAAETPGIPAELRFPQRAAHWEFAPAPLGRLGR